MFRAGGIGGDEGKIDVGLHRGGQLDLRLFGGFFQTLQRQLVLAKVDALAGFELVGKKLDDLVIEILAAKEGVAIGRLHLKDAVANLENRHVESAAAKIIDNNQTGFALVETIGQRGGCRLVDDAEHLETGYLAGVFGGLPLRIVEVGGNGDYCFGDALAKKGLSVFLQLAKHEAGNLAWREFLAINLDPGIAILGVGDFIGDQFGKLVGRGIIMPAPDQTFDGEQGLFRVGDGLALCGLAYKAFLAIGEGDHRRRCAGTFSIFDDARIPAVHDGHAGICCSKVNTNHFGHDLLLSCSPVSGWAPW